MKKLEDKKGNPLYKYGNKLLYFCDDKNTECDFIEDDEYDQKKRNPQGTTIVCNNCGSTIKEKTYIKK